MGIEFKIPEFLSGSTPEEIQRRMMESLPPGIDDMPGGFPYDFTMPTALEKAELINFHLVRTLMLMFPMWAWDEWLDYHAEAAGLNRHAAGYASGEVTVSGTEGIVIPKGTIFATPATDTGPSIEFSADSDYEIGENGTVVVKVTAVVAGKRSNVSIGTVNLLLKPIKGITKICNEKAITGGTERESDEALRGRIQEANESGGSYTGNDSDYIRWAKMVIGVGTVMVVPEWNGPGTVKLIVLDENGQPANSTILKKVYDYIISPEDRLQRLAPIGANLTVVAPEIVSINFSAKIKMTAGYKIGEIEKEFRSRTMEYYEVAKDEGVLKYTKLAAVLSNTMGVADYTEFLVNGKEENIPIARENYPETGIVDFKGE